MVSQRLLTLVQDAQRILRAFVESPQGVDLEVWDHARDWLKDVDRPTRA